MSVLCISSSDMVSPRMVAMIDINSSQRKSVDSTYLSQSFVQVKILDFSSFPPYFSNSHVTQSWSLGKKVLIGCLLN